MEEMSVFFSSLMIQDMGFGRQADVFLFGGSFRILGSFVLSFGRILGVYALFFSMLYRAGIFLGAGEVQWSGV